MKEIKEIMKKKRLLIEMTAVAGERPPGAKHDNNIYVNSWSEL